MKIKMMGSPNIYTEGTYADQRNGANICAEYMVL
ncbi:hypothetical protein S225a_26200 [Candidatus Brocadiaceae bacterium S225]|nr:hypothetical protein S225a_26200 [Candidatus Brocadiaceae bacterium S225]